MDRNCGGKLGPVNVSAHISRNLRSYTLTLHENENNNILALWILNNSTKKLAVFYLYVSHFRFYTSDDDPPLKSDSYESSNLRILFYSYATKIFKPSQLSEANYYWKKNRHFYKYSIFGISTYFFDKKKLFTQLSGLLILLCLIQYMKLTMLFAGIILVKLCVKGRTKLDVIIGFLY